VISRLRLLGFACLRAALVAGATILAAEILSSAAVDPDAVRRAILLTGAGAAVGSAMAGFQIHPRRSLGLLPPAAMGLCITLIAAALSDRPWSETFCLTLGLFAGLAGAALRAVLQAVVRLDLPAAPIDAVATASLLVPLILIEAGALAPAAWWCGVLAAAVGLAAVASWGLLSIHTLELIVEFVVWPMYNIRAHGPGLSKIPRRGPVLLIANHSSYADPFWLSKVVPRKVTPMMTSVFYDLPVIHWFMVHAVGAIRVQAATFRREAPELREAVAMLRRGGCVLLFPEGTLRKREQQLLLPFGQGVWHILKELPQTPVVFCWIEGGWGSFASYYKGLPMQKKRLDLRRTIDIALSEPRVVDPTVLADQRATRTFLRQACLEGRKSLGLPVPEESEKNESGQDEKREENEGQNDVHPINP
jgi:1-acyl-sn-glycerol-3-phosphate acyltransferase